MSEGALPDLFVPFDPSTPVEELSGHLPHWRQSGTTYFVTFRTADSLPRAMLEQWECERAAWWRAHPEPHSEADRREYAVHFPARFEEWLDHGYGACPLADSEPRQIVENALRHFDGDRYELGEFVVMANHVHALVAPLAEHELSGILHSWKSYTAGRVNKLLGQSGAFWQRESFDHIVRSPASLERFAQYIRDNPKSARRSRVAEGQK